MEYLIPEGWFLGLPQWQLLVLVAIAIAALGKASDVVVEGASGIASVLGISKIVIGATIVSLGTTSPECAVSVLAAWSGEPGLALGNASRFYHRGFGADLRTGLPALGASRRQVRFVSPGLDSVRFGCVPRRAVLRVLPASRRPGRVG